MIVKLHSEQFLGLNRDKLRARLETLVAKYPGSTVTHRRMSGWGNGYTITVKGEGEAKSIQTRGHCQFCGNHQVIKDGVLVLHGYQRPGNGWIFGRCPGAAEKPLQVDETITRATLKATQERLAALQKRQPKLALAETKTEAEYRQHEAGMLYAMPSKGYKYGASDAEKAQIESDYQNALAAWFVRHPFTAAYVKARDAKRALDIQISQAEGGVQHFTLLLSWKLLGTALLQVAKG